MAKHKREQVIIPANIHLSEHELSVIPFLLAIGNHVEFLQPSRIRGQKSPDVRIDGVLWEIKSPKGTSNRTIENNFRAALNQAVCIVFDLRRSKLPEEKALREIKRQFSLAHKVQRVFVVRRNGTTIDFLR